MRNLLMRNFIFFVFSIGLVHVSHGQIFKGEANLPEIQSDGFYRIFISPQLDPYLNSNLSNIRVYDRDNKEVPYLIQEERPTYHTQQFREYEIVEKTQKKNCCTFLTLKNLDSRSINNISLSIKNAEVVKHATLLGSDDKKNWFALKQRFSLSSIDNHNGVSEIKVVDFPLSNYVYYLLQIDDSTSAPVNVLNAGYYETNSEDGKYTVIRTSRSGKTDSASQKRTYLNIKFDSARIVDKLSVSMAGPPYFLRRATLYSKNERLSKKGVKAYYLQVLDEFEISAKQSSVIELPGVTVSELLIKIENNDNPPLDMASVNAYQLNRYCVAWLKKGSGYHIKVGNTDLPKPVYDLEFFRDSISAHPVILNPGNPILYDMPKPMGTKTFFTSQTIIWAALAVVIIVLGVMSVRMMREAGKNNDTGNS
jgi:hypothetical protein